MPKFVEVFRFNSTADFLVCTMLTILVMSVSPRINFTIISIINFTYMVF